MTGLALAVLLSSLPALVWTECPKKCTCSTNYVLISGNLPDINGSKVSCRNLNLKVELFDSDTHFLNLDDNNIPELEIVDDGGNTRNLKHVQAENSKVQEIGRFDADDVTHLLLKNNKFQKVPLTSRSVLALHLSNNQIPNDNEHNLLFYFKLIRLELNNNRFVTMPIVPHSLEQLILSNNKISFVDNQILRWAPNLNLLALENNDLFKISLPEAYFMVKIKKLQLENNPNIYKGKTVDRWCKNDSIGGKVCALPTES